MGRHSAPRSTALLTPAEPIKTGPRHAQPPRSRQSSSRPIALDAAALAHRHSALHRPAHHRAGVARPAVPNRPPLWRRSPAVPAAVAVLAVWSGANLPNVLSAGHAGSESRATSSEVERSTLAAGGDTLGGSGVLADGSGAAGASTAGDVPAAEDANTASAAARLAADRRVSRGNRTAPGDGATAAALKRPAAAVKAVKAVKPAAKAAKAAAKPAKVVASRWVRPSAGGQSSCFCMRWGSMHDGIDLAGPNGSPIVAVGDGVVVESGPAAGYGMWVVIRHSNGDHSVYAHMYRTYVSVGEQVRAGRHIADIGSNGFSTGPHLHFEIAKGSATGPRVDPAPWLRARGVEVGPYNPDA